MKNTENSLPAVALLLDSARGIYIPRDFVESFDLSLWNGITDENIEILKNPDHEYYWEAWDEVLNNATFVENGFTWYLSQDGDLWVMCYELMTNEDRHNFGIDNEA